jgi:hypothetical protein
MRRAAGRENKEALLRQDAENKEEIMVTGNEIFTIAMALVDEVTPEGAPTREGEREFAGRAPLLLTSLAGEVYAYSSGYEGGSPPVLASLADAVPLDDALCRTVLPYGLAARLMLEENPATASFFEARFEELLGRNATRRRAVSEDITDLYGIRGGGNG